MGNLLVQKTFFIPITDYLDMCINLNFEESLINFSLAIHQAI